MRTVLLSLLAVYLAVCALFFVLQAKLIWFPGSSRGITPASAGLDFRDLRLTTADGETLRAWLVAPREPARGVLLVSHGNAGTIEDRLEITRCFTGFGLAVLLYDYRGYGGSTGSPSESGTYADALAAWNELVERQGFAPEKIVLYGESLGGGVAVELATQVQAAGLILVDTFSSLPDVGAFHYPWLPVRTLARVRYDNIGKIGRVTMPKLVIHSPDDEIVPCKFGKKLFEAAGEPKELLVTGGSHNEIGYLLRAEWKERVRAFVGRVLARTR